MKPLLLDIRYAFRTLTRKRRFTVAVLLSLGLGIGLNLAVFSFVNAVLLRPFPYKDPGGLAIVWGTKSFDVRRGMNGADVETWRKASHAFADIGVFQMNPFPFAVGPDQTEVVQGALVGPRTFTVLGVQPFLGHTFSELPEEPQESGIVVLSYGFWRSHFAGNIEVIGKPVELNAKPYTIVGIMPRGFFFPDQTTELWVPLTKTSAMFAQVQALARLRPGATIKQAEAEIDTLSRVFPRSNSGSSLELQPGVFSLYNVLVGKYKTALEILFAAVTLLVLIACANVSNLMLARGVGREREFAIRSSLGASRWRILRLVLIENSLLSLGAGAFGTGCAWWGVLALRSLRLTDIPRFGSAGIDLHVLLFALGISSVTGLLSGIIPGWKAARMPMITPLQSDGVSTRSRGEGQLRDLLVTIEVALALVLLVGAGLLVNSFLRLTHANWGFNPEKLLLIVAPLPRSLAQIPGQRIEYGNKVLDRLSMVPGVTSCAMAYGVPIDYGYTPQKFEMDGHMVNWDAETSFVSKNYFRTMGIPVLSGREFDQHDEDLSPRSLIVSQNFAERLWAGKSPIGRYVQMLKLKKDLEQRALKDPRHALPLGIMESPASWEADGAPREVVGEVGNVRMFGLDIVPEPDIYIDYSQASSLVGAEKFVIRTSIDSNKLISTVKSEIVTAASGVTIGEVAAFSGLTSQSIGGHGSNKLLLVISTLFGSLSLLLAAIGVYGVVSFGVVQRTREIGVRRALGAQEVHIVFMVIRQALRPVILGIFFGLTGTFAVVGMLRGFLFGITPTDPLTIAGISILLVGSAGVACVVPTMRALRINPSEALHYE
jgi:putative ABC transport system permease protein